MSFSIKKYNDEMLCAIVSVQVGYIFLNIPCQYDEKVTHDGFRKNYTFVKDSKNITRVPFTSSQICEDSIRMKKEKEKE